jgi:uncharacterized protein (TIGR03435 family)
MLSATNTATLGILITGILFGQHYDTSPVFETASIKPHASGRTTSPSIQHGILAGTNVTLKHLLQLAYEVQDPQISGPSWIETEGYDVVGKAESSASDTQVRLMLQQLLADRFQLKSHLETKELVVYWLTVAEGGPKLRDPKEEEAFNAAAAGKSPFQGRPFCNLLEQRPAWICREAVAGDWASRG